VKKAQNMRAPSLYVQERARVCIGSWGLRQSQTQRQTQRHLQAGGCGQGRQQGWQQGLQQRGWQQGRGGGQIMLLSTFAPQQIPLPTPEAMQLIPLQISFIPLSQHGRQHLLLLQH